MLLFTDFNSTSVILDVFHIQTADEHQNMYHFRIGRKLKFAAKFVGNFYDAIFAAYDTTEHSFMTFFSG